jgi:hypothetical protein
MNVDDYRVKAFMLNALIIYKALGPNKDKRCQVLAYDNSDGLQFEVFLRNEKEILAMANDCEKFSKNWEIRQVRNGSTTKFTVFIIEESDISVQRLGEWAYNKQIRMIDCSMKLINGSLVKI